MAEPRIQYARTEDGVNIAYCDSGQGVPFVLLSDMAISHVQLERKYLPSIHEPENWARLIRFDPRGTGMSDREIERFSLESWMLDIDAVVTRLGLETFALGSINWSSVLAIAYVTRHPDRVSHLCMVNPVARPVDAMASSTSRALAGMLATDWDMFSENVGSLTFGWAREEAHVFAELIRACTTQRTLTRILGALASCDVTDLLPTIKAPTLVMHHAGVKYVPLDLARDLAARIPDSSLVVREGVFTTNAEALAPIREFLLGQAAPAPHAQADASTLRTVLFTDLVGHTEMMSRLGDERGRAVLREHEDITRNVLKQYGGAEVKTMGDGFMASFGSVTKAVECAIALQRAFAEREGEPLAVRVGLNAGEPIEEDGDLFGATVILASRIAAKAEGGEILVADTVRGLCSGKGFLFADRGEFVAKGFEEPVRVYEVSWRP